MTKPEDHQNAFEEWAEGLHDGWATDEDLSIQYDLWRMDEFKLSYAADKPLPGNNQSNTSE